MAPTVPLWERTQRPGPPHLLPQGSGTASEKFKYGRGTGWHR